MNEPRWCWGILSLEATFYMIEIFDGRLLVCCCVLGFAFSSGVSGAFFFFFLVFSAISTSRFLSLSPRIRWSWFGFLYHTRGPTIVTSYWCRFRYFTAGVMHIWCSNSKTISFYVITLMLSRIILCSYSLYATSKGCITKSCSLRITLYYECISIKVLHQ